LLIKKATKKRRASATTLPKLKCESIMANKSTSGKGSEQPDLKQPESNNDEVCIMVPRRLVKAVTYLSTHIAVPIALYSFVPYLPSSPPKQGQCSQPPTAQVISSQVLSDQGKTKAVVK
jgi:hypothetical protein